MAWLLTSDLVLRAGGEEEFVRLADRDGSGTADATLVAAAIAWAEAALKSQLRDSHGSIDYLNLGENDPILRDLAARLALGYLEETSAAFRNVKREPGTGWKAGALADIKVLSEGRGAELASVAEPYASASAYVSAPTPVWGNAARDPSDPDGGGWSGF